MVLYVLLYFLDLVKSAENSILSIRTPGIANNIQVGDCLEQAHEVLADIFRMVSTSEVDVEEQIINSSLLCAQ